MPDPFRKVRPNERVEFSATAWNAMLAAGQAQLNHQFDSGSNGASQIRQSGIIRIRNDSGIDLNRNSVLGLDSPIFLPSDSEDAFLREVCFGGSVPTTDHRGRFCILLEPVLDGRIARAWVAGACPVLVDVSDDAHTTADIEAGETLSLVSSDSGSAQIVWREGMEPYGTSTGLQWAVVRFGSTASGGGGEGKIAKTGGGGISARSGDTPGSGSVTEYTLAGSTLTAGDSFTAYNLASEAVAGDTWIQTKSVGGTQWIDWEECAAAAAGSEASPPSEVTSPSSPAPPGGTDQGGGDGGFDLVLGGFDGTVTMGHP